MENIEIARALEDVAALLEIRGANFFQVRAYENAARIIESHAEPLRKWVEEGQDLTAIEGVGKDMAGYITELVKTGRLERLEKLKQEVPETLIEVTRLPGIGPKRTGQLWKALGVTDLASLEKAARAGQVAELKGFGDKLQKQILSAIEARTDTEKRFRLSDADRYVEPLLGYLKEAPGVKRLEVAGSYRRRRETVGDLDLLAVAEDPTPVMEHFRGYPAVDRIVGSGETKTSLVLRAGLQVDLRVVPEKSFGAAMVYFTGSKAHNIKLRRRAVERGLRISEYGVFRTDEADAAAAEGERDPWAGEWIAGRTEAEVYETVDLGWVPPELREDRGEIEAAIDGDLPALLELGDIRGDLQMHTTWSDGRNSLTEMLDAATARGYEYIAITDHSASLAVVRGLDADKLKAQWDEMDEVMARRDDIRLLRSMEVDVLPDGSLDLDDELLERLDIVLVSVHSQLDLSRQDQTDRIIKALRHPQVNILGHPTGRRIGERPPMKLDLDAILECAAENGVAIEHNASPARLDLPDTGLMRAVELGVPIVISTDAHTTRELGNMRYGVEQARRAWLTADDVINTRPIGGLLAALGIKE